MPELPDITLYLEALSERISQKCLEEARILNPFLVRTVEPGVEIAHGLRVTELRRVGKRVAIGFESELWFVFHLMIAGRFQWHEMAPKGRGRGLLAVLRFESGTLTLTEAGTKKRASLHVVSGERGLRSLDPAGLEIATASLGEFSEAVTRENHTLKRTLTDPRILSGIGNAYSDEILHRAQLSPVALSTKLDPGEIERLYRATRETLSEWTERLRSKSAGEFPKKVTAFHEEMAVHGRYGQACPTCGTEVQRIRYATNETNYCPRCQTGGRLLADRALSRLLKKDWPRSIDELERRQP